MTQKTNIASHSADDKVWLVESSYSNTREAAYGSAVLIRARDTNRSKTTNSEEFYLLTCAHLLTNKSGQVTDKILCWEPGTNFYKQQDLYSSSYQVVITLPEHFNNGVDFLQYPENDWALLKFVSKQPESDSRCANYWSTEPIPGEEYRYTILGYFNGFQGISQKLAITGVVNGHKKTVQPDKVMGNRIHEVTSHSLVLKGPEDTQTGTSGGGVFDRIGKFYGIHRANSVTYDSRYTLSTAHIKRALEDCGFFPKTDSFSADEYTKFQPLIQLPFGVLVSLTIFLFGLSLYIFDNTRANEFLIASIASGTIFIALCIIEWIVLDKPLSESGGPIERRLEILKKDIFNRHSYHYLVSAYTRFLTRIFDIKRMNSASPQSKSYFSSITRYFSTSSFDRVLLLASTYPLIAMMLTWCLFGDLKIGSVTVLPPSSEQPWNRYLMVFLLGISALLLSSPAYFISSKKFVRWFLPFLSGSVAFLSVLYFYKLTISKENGFDTNVPILLSSLLTITIISGFSGLRVKESVAALVLAIFTGNILLLLFGFLRIETNGSIVKAVYFNSPEEAIVVANANILINFFPPIMIFILVLSTFALSLYCSMWIVLSHIKKKQFSGFAATLVGLSLSTPCTLALHSSNFDSIDVSASLAIGLIIIGIVLKVANLSVQQYPRITYLFLYFVSFSLVFCILLAIGYYLESADKSGIWR